MLYQTYFRMITLDIEKNGICYKLNKSKCLMFSLKFLCRTPILESVIRLVSPKGGGGWGWRGVHIRYFFPWIDYFGYSTVTY